MESAGKDEPALAPEVQCRCSAGGVPAGVEEAHAGGQNPAEGEEGHEATSQVEGHDLLRGEDPREHLEHGSVSAVLERCRGEAGAGVPAGCSPEGSTRPVVSCALEAG